MSLNKCIIMGRLGADPELRYTQNQKAVATLSVATSEKGKDGPEVTTWHRVVVWGKNAESCGQYLKKGSPVFLEGSLKNNKWEGKDGITRYSTQIETFYVTFLDGKPKEQPNQVPNLPEFEVAPPKPQVSQVAQPSIDFDLGDSSIPF